MIPCVRSIFLLLFGLLCLQIQAQDIVIDCTEQPLNEVLLSLKNTHEIQLSFDEQRLKKCNITLKETFTTPQQAIETLLKQCELSYQYISEVFVIYDKKSITTINEKKGTYQFSGRIVDMFSQEPLPFAAIQINEMGIVTDLQGNFAYHTTDSLLSIKISYLGYHFLDSICVSKPNQILRLKPKVIGLQELIVRDKKVENNSWLPPKIGLTKINHQVATFLPGNNNNTLFNLLRLQAGVLAAGEQSKDFFIWGSYKGQTQILFDGMTLFSTSSVNENIGTINPLIIQDVEVYKGGYNVDIGDRVGGVVNITGKSGNQNKLYANLNLNNQLVSGSLNIPIRKKAALQLSFRKTYYNLFTKNNKVDFINENIANYGDLNLKYAGSFNSGDTYYLSLFNSRDTNKENWSEIEEERFYFLNAEIENRQKGAALFYGKKWKKGHQTHINFAHSQLNTDFYNTAKYQEAQNEKDFKIVDNSTTNSIEETSLKLKHYFPTNKIHSLSIGANLIHNKTTFSQDTSKQSFKNSEEELTRYSIYLKDKIHLHKNVHFEVGLKSILPSNNLPISFQPRVNVNYKIHPNLNINASYGHYLQYIAENSIVDQFNNALYFWDIVDKKNGVLESNHYVIGTTYRSKKIEGKIEVYHKTLNGLSRFVQQDIDAPIQFSEGKGEIYGIDFFLKKDFQKHKLWIAYTLSETKEYFDFFKEKTHRRAPHDQRHELKGAGILNFSPFHFSINYVYGSGFPNIAEVTNEIPIYSRLDIAALYEISIKKAKLQTGISILNLLNQKNVKYNNFSNFPDNKTIYFPAIPITPTVFVNVQL